MMLSPKILTLAEYLAGRGFICGAVITSTKTQYWGGFHQKIIANTNHIEGVNHDVIASREAVQWLEKNHENRFFLWLHYFDPHSPYSPPKRYKRKFVDPSYSGKLTGSEKYLKEAMATDKDLTPDDMKHLFALYDAEIRKINDQIGLVLSTLERLGKADRTLIVLTADHGETLYDRAKYFLHASSVHESVLRIPLIFKFPEVVPKGLPVSTVVETIDIAPTILELLGLPIPDAFQGSSLVPLLRGEHLDLGPAFSERSDRILTIRTATHRFVWNPLEDRQPLRVGASDMKKNGYSPAIDRPYPIAKEELFNTSLDRKELNNIVHENPELAEELLQQLMKWIDETSWKLDGAKKLEIDEETLRNLEALGYLQ